MSAPAPAYPRTQAARFGGRVSAHGPRATPTSRAGAPDHAVPGGIPPNTADPGATSAPAPTDTPGHSMLRPPILAFAPIVTLPRWSTSPSSQ